MEHGITRPKDVQTKYKQQGKVDEVAKGAYFLVVSGLEANKKTIILVRTAKLHAEVIYVL